jgi:hypothetical protein
MNKFGALILAAATLFSVAYAGTKKPWDGTYTPYKVNYLLYSNDLDEKQAPTPNDRRMSFMVEGHLAQEMFESIGPDQKLACGSTLGVRLRSRGDVECTYDKDDGREPYTCHFGLDLRNGKSIAGSTC